MLELICCWRMETWLEDVVVVVVALLEQVVVGVVVACSGLTTDHHHWELETGSLSSSDRCTPRQHLDRKEVFSDESEHDDTYLVNEGHERMRGPKIAAETEPCSEPRVQDPDAEISLWRSGTLQTLEYKPAPGTLSDNSSHKTQELSMSILLISEIFQHTTQV